MMLYVHCRRDAACALPAAWETLTASAGSMKRLLANAAAARLVGKASVSKLQAQAVTACVVVVGAQQYLVLS